MMMMKRKMMVISPSMTSGMTTKMMTRVMGRMIRRKMGRLRRIPQIRVDVPAQGRGPTPGVDAVRDPTHGPVPQAHQDPDPGLQGHPQGPGQSPGDGTTAPPAPSPARPGHAGRGGPGQGLGIVQARRGGGIHVTAGRDHAPGRGHIQGTGNIPESNASVEWEWWQRSRSSSSSSRIQVAPSPPHTHRHTPAAMAGV